MSTADVIVIAGRERAIEGCLAQLRQYPGRTITGYDLPGPGNPAVLTRDEVARTRVIYSRISEEQLAWFVERATTAPWPPADADLLRAEPNIRDGLYDQLNPRLKYQKVAFWAAIRDDLITNTESGHFRGFVRRSATRADENGHGGCSFR